MEHISPKPKAFISYSWSSIGHQKVVLEWAERLVGDGVDVVLDLYHLKEGQDKYVFMERMVTDPEVTHVLLISDKKYSEKADARKAGVGTESQIFPRKSTTRSLNRSLSQSFASSMSMAILISHDF